MNERLQIVASAQAMRDAGALFSVLESLWPVAFGAQPRPSVAARIVDEVAGIDAETALTLSVPPADASIEEGTPSEVRFADEAEVPWPYRGRRFATRLHVAAQRRASSAAEKVLASDASGRPLWTVEHRGGRRIYRSQLRLPRIADGHDIAGAAGGERFIQALPLFHLVREASGQFGYALPPLRASFIVDDPNLHWPRYGFADYRAIARHAGCENYHVAFATIPLDTWFTHRASAAIFREHCERISLLIHGNDHGRDELALNRSPAACAALLRKAIARIEALEAKSGLRVCRVMVPPHGACSEAMLAQLPGNGFEAACISAGSLRAHNPGRRWTGSVGFAPSEVVAGCPVLPRWPLAGTGEDVLLATAYLGQPLILRAHHQDLKDGLEVFGAAARFINSLGPVRWCGMTGISRLNYRWRSAGSDCRVRPSGMSIAIDVPPATTRVIVEAAAFAWTALDAQGTLTRAGPNAELAVAVRPGETIDVARDADKPRACTAVAAAARTSPRLVVRRLLTEARDRLLV